MAYGNAFGGGYGDVNQASARPDFDQPPAWQTYWANQANPDYQREQFERGLMQGEQQRRAYDSDTNRRKYGILSGLFGRLGGGATGGGYSSSFAMRSR